jgi:hypothetical protein
MLRTIAYHPHVHGVDRLEPSRCQCRAPTASPRLPIATAVRAVWSAWRESLAAHGDYERLRSRGLSHDAALREALALGPAKNTGASAKPLHFAGRV